MCYDGGCYAILEPGLGPVRQNVPGFAGLLNPNLDEHTKSSVEGKADGTYC
jgi:hypothetical protein